MANVPRGECFRLKLNPTKKKHKTVWSSHLLCLIEFDPSSLHGVDQPAHTLRLPLGGNEAALGDGRLRGGVDRVRVLVELDEPLDVRGEETGEKKGGMKKWKDWWSESAEWEK